MKLPRLLKVHKVDKVKNVIHSLDKMCITIKCIFVTGRGKKNSVDEYHFEDGTSGKKSGTLHRKSHILPSEY